MIQNGVDAKTLSNVLGHYSGPISGVEPRGSSKAPCFECAV